MNYELQCPRCKEKFSTDSPDFKFCPYCSVRLDSVEPDFKPLDSGEISDKDKIKAFDELFVMAKNKFIDARNAYEKGSDYYDDEDDQYYMYEAVMELLGIGIVDGKKKMWKTFNKYLE